MKITKRFFIYFYKDYIGFWFFQNSFVVSLYLGFMIIIIDKEK
jgi:hypothetical protein